MKDVIVTGDFDDLRSRHVRFLEEAATYGPVHVGLWSDEAVQARDGTLPKFSERERFYLLKSLDFVDQVSLLSGTVDPDGVPNLPDVRPYIWIVDEESDSRAKRASAEARRIDYRIIKNDQLRGFPIPSCMPSPFDPQRRRVIVTGCFDWFHSGHVRFFEEASALGDLYVIVGHDANIRFLKGEGHPLLPQSERLYMVHSIRYVHHAMLSTGHGWLDAEPEIALLRPHIYVVNEDGDKPEKRAFCATHDIQYVVLKRIPKEGLPKRESTILRGF